MYSQETRNILHCMFQLVKDGQGVDMMEVAHLVKRKFSLTSKETQEWFEIAYDEGAIEEGDDRMVQ